MSRHDHNPRQMVVLESDPGVPLTGRPTQTTMSTDHPHDADHRVA